MLVVSRIFAVFSNYRDNSAKPNISRNVFPATRNLKKIGLESICVTQKYSFSSSKRVGESSMNFQMLKLKSVTVQRTALRDRPTCLDEIYSRYIDKAVE